MLAEVRPGLGPPRLFRRPGRRHRVRVSDVSSSNISPVKSVGERKFNFGEVIAMVCLPRARLKNAILSRRNWPASHSQTTPWHEKGVASRTVLKFALEKQQPLSLMGEPRAAFELPGLVLLLPWLVLLLPYSPPPPRTPLDPPPQSLPLFLSAYFPLR